MNEELINNEKEIFMTSNPRVLVSDAVLNVVESNIIIVVWARVYIFTSINQLWSLVISIFTIFVSTTEVEVRQSIK